MVFSSPFTLSAFQGRSSFYWLIAAIFKQLLQLINVVGFSVYAMCTLHEPEDIHVDMKKLTWQYTPISIKVALGFGHWNTEYNAMLCLSDHQTIAFEVKARFPKQPLLKQVYNFCSWRLSRNGRSPVASGHKASETFRRVSMGLTDRRETAKNLVDSRKNWKISGFPEEAGEQSKCGILLCY